MLSEDLSRTYILYIYQKKTTYNERRREKDDKIEEKDINFFFTSNKKKKNTFKSPSSNPFTKRPEVVVIQLHWNVERETESSQPTQAPNKKSSWG